MSRNFKVQVEFSPIGDDKLINALKALAAEQVKLSKANANLQISAERVNQAQIRTKILLDKALLDAEYASFHPMDNAASTAINKEGMMKLKELSGRDDETFEIIDFVQLNGAPAGDNGGGE